MAMFVSGLELSRLFYFEAVKPVLNRSFPGLQYSAAVIGSGSEVLGFDDEISTDHHWGPRLLLFLGDKATAKLAADIKRQLGQQLPFSFHGYSTNFSNPEPNGVRHSVAVSAAGPVNHMVECCTIRGFFQARLGVEPFKKLSAKDWLSIPQQRLLEVTSGAVYHDGLGKLEMARKRFSYYPDEIWLYLLSNQWKKISQEEAFVGRAGASDDELGSRVVAARLVRELMLLSFLIERRYAPYSKWLGRAFTGLRLGKRLSTILIEVLAANNWKARETSLSKAFSVVSKAHNKLGITEPLPTSTSNYFSRQFKVIHADVFAEAIRKSLRSRTVRNLRPYVGSIDQFVDSTDVLNDLVLCQELKTVY